MLIVEIKMIRIFRSMMMGLIVGLTLKELRREEGIGMIWIIITIVMVIVIMSLIRIWSRIVSVLIEVGV